MDISETIEQLGVSFDAFKSRINQRLAAEEEERKALNSEVLLMQATRRGAGAETDIGAPVHWRDSKTGRPVPVLSHKQRLANLEQNSGIGAEGSKSPSIGRLLRGLCLGGRADDYRQLEEERKAMGISLEPGGGITVPSAVASYWIDLLRAKMVLSQAGALTVPMPSADLTIARVTADPTVQWHLENAAITASDPNLGGLTLTARTVVALTKFSLELAQDSVNIEQLLEATLTRALASAIDSAGLKGTTTNAGAAPNGIMNVVGRNSVTSIGAPTSWDFLVDGCYELMADNVPLESVGAFIAHPSVWKKLRKLKTGITNDNTPLTMPAEIEALPKLWTTAAPLVSSTAAGIVGKWDDLLFGVRQDLAVRVLSETFMGSNLQLAVLVYARCDFGAARPSSFCTLEGITVS